jgi:RNA polymerase sigma factor (TIGR02999 family)
LRRVARRQRRRGTAQTLDTTALVHEAYLKLANAENLQVSDRGHLLAVAASAMQQALIGRARARLRLKRGRGDKPLELDESRVAGSSPSERLLDIDRALDALRRQDERLAHIFECRFFGGSPFPDRTSKRRTAGCASRARPHLRPCVILPACCHHRS